MTATTPIYGIEYLMAGEPARNTRLALENNAKTIEAALVRGGIAPPAAQDLATLAGRVTTLEGSVSALEPGPWFALPLRTTGTSPWAALGVAYRSPRYRLLPAINSVELDGLLATGGVGTIATLPVGFRPNVTDIRPGQYGDGGARALFIQPTGVIEIPGAATTTWLSLGCTFPLT